MRKRIVTILLAPLFAVPLMTEVSAAPARGTSARTPRPHAARSKATTSRRPGVQRALREMRKMVWDDAAASYTNVVFDAGVKVTMLREDNYEPAKGINVSKLLKVSGKGLKAGSKVKISVLNNVSAHDLYHTGMSDARFRQAVNSRIASDLVRVSVRYPNGTIKVLADRVPSKDVTEVPVELDLQVGISEVRVDRLNRAGQVVGSSSMLGGRRVEIQFDGQ